MYTGKFVELVFHAKGEQQRLPGGAGRPPLGRPTSPRPSGLGMWPRGHRLCRDALDPLRKSVAVVWLQAAVRGRPASPRPAGLALTSAQARFALTH